MEGNILHRALVSGDLQELSGLTPSGGTRIELYLNEFTHSSYPGAAAVNSYYWERGLLWTPRTTPTVSAKWLDPRLWPTAIASRAQQALSLLDEFGINSTESLLDVNESTQLATNREASSISLDASVLILLLQHAARCRPTLLIKLLSNNVITPFILAGALVQLDPRQCSYDRCRNNPGRADMDFDKITDPTTLALLGHFPIPASLHSDTLCREVNSNIALEPPTNDSSASSLLMVAEQQGLITSATANAIVALAPYDMVPFHLSHKTIARLIQPSRAFQSYFGTGYNRYLPFIISRYGRQLEPELVITALLDTLTLDTLLAAGYWDPVILAGVIRVSMHWPTATNYQDLLRANIWRRILAWLRGRVVVGFFPQPVYDPCLVEASYPN